jgi:hypothetical protein
MGLLLMMSLGFTLFNTLLVLPALLAGVNPTTARPVTSLTARATSEG